MSRQVGFQREAARGNNGRIRTARERARAEAARARAAARGQQRRNPRLEVDAPAPAGVRRHGFFTNVALGAATNAVITVATNRIQGSRGAQTPAFFAAGASIVAGICTRDLNRVGFGLGMGAMAAINTMMDMLGQQNGPTNRP